MKLFETVHCQSQAHCVACRTSRPFRENLLKIGLVTEPEFVCPFGKDANGLGDFIEGLLKPIAVALKLPCYENGKLKAESGCAKRRDALNALRFGRETQGNPLISPSNAPIENPILPDV